MDHEPIDEAPDASRRGFLRGATIAAPALALAGAATASAQGNRINIPTLYPGQNSRFFREIQDDENAHVQAIVSTLGSAARPKPTFQNLGSPNVRRFLNLSVAFENTGVGAYLGAARYISNPDLLAAAASIALVEAYHSGYLNTLANAPLVPGRAPFASPLTTDEVIGRVSPFIANLNGGPPLTFSTTPSAQNDIAIFNFALALEYLEAEFYNINVPRIFRGGRR